MPVCAAGRVVSPHGAFIASDVPFAGTAVFVTDPGVPHIALDKQQQRINGEINAPEIRLVGADGEQLGIVSLAEAMAKAEAAELDLVEIAPTAKPPVCRIMDYGKFKYREAKKQHEAKLKLKQIKVKEVKFRPGTDDGDYKIKLRNLIQFLADGDKAKITLRFRGREMAHQEFGVRLLERIKADLDPYAQVEQFPKLEGRQMVMLLAPRKTQVQQPPKHPANKPEAGRPSGDGDKAPPPAAAVSAAGTESTTVGSK